MANLVVFVYGFLLYLVFYYIREYFQRKKSPPGPWPIPILGNLVQIARTCTKTDIALDKICSEYGDLTRIKFGSQETIVLSSYEVTKELGSNSNTTGRFLDGLLFDRNEGKKFGIILAEGKFWDTKKTWLMKTLRGFGFGRSHKMESNTNEVIQEFLKNVEEHMSSGQTAFDIEGIFPYATFKIMWKMLIGRLSETDEIDIRRLLYKSEKMLKAGNLGPGILTVFPFLKYIFPGLTGYKVSMDFSEDCKHVGKKLLAEAQESITKWKETPESLREAYAAEMELDPHSANFNEQDFGILFMDLLQAASDTTSAFLESAVLFLVLYPKVQDRICREIEKYIPKGQEATYIHLKGMLYTQAFMAEVHRVTKIAPFLVPKRATKDFYYRGFLFKENTNIFINMHAIFNNKKVMGEDTDKFRPERFLSEDDDGVMKDNYRHVIPYGIGKRMCAGVPLAEVSGFLFLVNILQNYELLPVPGKPLPSAEMNFGITCKPYPFQICIRKRKQ